MIDAFPDALFVFDGIGWLRWLVGCFFFLLGLFMGWWKWHYRRVVKKGGQAVPKLSFSEAGESELVASEFGLIYQSEPPQVDDLQEIKGVGKALRAKLYSIGIYKFEQIADLNDSEVAAVSKKLHLANQIDADEWRDQAKSLKT